MAKVTSVPVVVLTGFLGSGKTSLLRRMLRSDSRRVAVLINEFGEIGIDHEILGTVAPDVVLLGNGCLCCAVKGELRDAVLDLLRRRDCGELPVFDRLVLETSGLAEPAPLLSTLSSDRALRGRVHLAAVVTTVDSLNATEQAETAPEWAAQVAAADMVCLTKTDLVNAADLHAVRALVHGVNAIAAIADARDIQPDAFFDLSILQSRGFPIAEGSPTAGHLSGVRSFSIVMDRPVEWERFALWLSLLLHRHGSRILRVKALLDFGLSGPVALHGVQHVVHAPVHEPAWPGADRRSRLVFIVRGIEPADIRHSFEIVVGRAAHARSSAA